jgi:hypothetical protein
MSLLWRKNAHTGAVVSVSTLELDSLVRVEGDVTMMLGENMPSSFDMIGV